jgi:hypothetical protein
MSQSDLSANVNVSYLEQMQGKLWRWDLVAIVGSVLLGVVMTVLAAVMERVDTALTGGAFVILGAINFYTIAALATLLFRLPGGLIAGQTNAFIAVATGTSPMAPWFIPTNAAFAIIYALVIWKFRMDRWWHHLLANVLGVWLSMLIIAWGLLVTIELPLNIVVISYLVTSVAGSLGATVLSIVLANAVDRSRVLQ